jgi:hypothetical protein
MRSSEFLYDTNQTIKNIYGRLLVPANIEERKHVVPTWSWICRLEQSLVCINSVHIGRQHWSCNKQAERKSVSIFFFFLLPGVLTHTFQELVPIIYRCCHRSATEGVHPAGLSKLLVSYYYPQDTHFLDLAWERRKNRASLRPRR